MTKKEPAKQSAKQNLGFRESVKSLSVNPVGAKATDMTAEGWVVSDYYFVDKIFTRKSQFSIGSGDTNMIFEGPEHGFGPEKEG